MNKNERELNVEKMKFDAVLTFASAFLRWQSAAAWLIGAKRPTGVQEPSSPTYQPIKGRES